MSNGVPEDVAAGLGSTLCVCRLQTMVGPQLAAHPIPLQPEGSDNTADNLSRPPASESQDEGDLTTEHPG